MPTSANVSVSIAGACEGCQTACLRDAACVAPYVCRDGSCGFAVSINAQALTQPVLVIYGRPQLMDTTEVQEVALTPGAYTFQLYSAWFSDVSFTVTSDGTVEYDPGLRGVLEGEGTNALVVKGREITVDATALSLTSIAPVLFSYPEISTQAPFKLTLLPAHAGYSFILGSVMWSNFYFDLDVAGQLHISDLYSGFASANGSNLTLTGSRVTVTLAPGLSEAGIISVLGNAISFSPLRATILRLLPVSPGQGYLVQTGGDAFSLFNLDLAGHFLIEADSQASLAGAGTSALYIRRHSQP
jgi:hypothetical protein